MSPLNILDKGWPFAASVLGGMFAFGSLHSDVADLRAQQIINTKDHDAITRIEQKQQDMDVQLKDIDSTLHRIEQSR